MRNRLVAASLALLGLAPAGARAAESPRVAVIVVGDDARRAGEAQREIESGLGKSAVRGALLPSSDLKADALVADAPAPNDEAVHEAIEQAKQAYVGDDFAKMRAALKSAEDALDAAPDAVGAAHDRWLVELWYVAGAISQSQSDEAETHAALAAVLSSAPVPEDTFPPAVTALVANKRRQLQPHAMPLRIAVSPARLATIAVDDSTPQSAALPLAVSLLEGRHRIRVAAPGYRAYSYDLTAKAGPGAPTGLDLWLAPSIESGLASRAAAFARGESAGDPSFTPFLRSLSADPTVAVVFATPTATGWTARVWRENGDPSKATSAGNALVGDLQDALRRPATSVAVGGSGEPGGGASHEAARGVGDASVGVFAAARDRINNRIPKPIDFSSGGVALGWRSDFGAWGLRAQALIAQVGIFGDSTTLNDNATSPPSTDVVRPSSPFVRVQLDGTRAFGAGFAGLRAGWETMSKDAGPASFKGSDGNQHSVAYFPRYTLAQAGPVGGLGIGAGPARIRADLAVLFGTYSESGPYTSASEKSAPEAEAQLGIEGTVPLGSGGWALVVQGAAVHRAFTFAGDSEVLDGKGTGVSIHETLVTGGISIARRF